MPNLYYSYIPILTGFCNFVTNDPSLDDLLPVEDELWNASVRIHHDTEIYTQN